MTPVDRSEFAAILAAVYDLYRAAFSDTVIAIWWAALERYPVEAVREALSRHVQNPDEGRFLPKPADVVRELQGTRSDASLAAWTRVADALRYVGPWMSVDFGDPVIHKVVEEIGGWIALGRATDADWPHVERRFRDRYRMYLSSGTRAMIANAPPYLPGMAEVANATRGFASQAAVRIGDGTGRAVALAPVRRTDLLTERGQ